MAHNRKQRMDEQLKRALQEIITNKVKDPRITCMVSVLSCRVAPDLSHAKVAVSLFGGDETAQKQTMQALIASKGYIRQEIKNYVLMRVLPNLSFEQDHSAEHSARIDQILKDIHKSDE